MTYGANYLIQLLKAICLKTKSLDYGQKLLILRGHLKLSGRSKDIYQQLLPYLNQDITEVAICSIFIIEQAENIFNQQPISLELDAKLKLLIEQLTEIEKFYSEIGGILGYHLKFVEAAVNQINKSNDRTYHPPPFYTATESSKSYLFAGLTALEKTVLFAPVGGAGDRFNLIDETTKNPLPLAMLPFQGRGLLAELFKDLKSFELLYYKLFEQKISIPIVLMTSDEKNNDQIIKSLLRQNNFFGKPEQDVYIIKQPGSPNISVDGNWSLRGPLQLYLKPGGHGVIWKLAQASGLFDKFKAQNYQHILVRQINNPLAAQNDALLTLLGIGSLAKKAFGSICCSKIKGVAEGATVLIKQKVADQHLQTISNLEYTEFSSLSSSELDYPSNTNILYGNISQIQQALEIDPFPGLIVNLKSQVPVIDQAGKAHYLAGGRVEATMQNIADNFLSTGEISTFTLMLEREKIISTTKQKLTDNESYNTPEKAFYDLQVLWQNFLKTSCNSSLPLTLSLADFLHKGPGCIIYLSPLLGPLYSIIAQKISCLNLEKGSELIIDMAEVNISQLWLAGSLKLKTKQPFDSTPKLIFKKVTIKNQGFEHHPLNSYWQNSYKCRQACEIIFGMGAELIADNVTILGDLTLEIPAYHRMILTNCPLTGALKRQVISNAKISWHWKEFNDMKDLSSTLNQIQEGAPMVNPISSNIHYKQEQVSNEQVSEQKHKKETYFKNENGQVVEREIPRGGFIPRYIKKPQEKND